MSNIKTYAFIFARGGSKGLKNKNLFSIGGKPLIAHSIEAAQNNKKIHKVFVSSDSNEIKNVSIEYGAEVIDRPKNLALDKTPEWLAWQHSVKYLKKKNEDFDVFLSLPSTSPLRSQLDINNLLNAFNKNVDAIISVKTVKNVKGAVEHILKYGTMHTDSIITNSKKNAEIFLNGVNSSIAMHNVSTQFADGGEFGFGGEIGISTNKLPPRGPVGINQLTSYKYLVSGKGIVRP